MVLHTVEDDKPLAGRLDQVFLNVELLAKPELFDLGFNQALTRLRQRLLDLTNANCPSTGEPNAFLNQHFAKEVRLAAASPTKRALVPGRL